MAVSDGPMKKKRSKTVLLAEGIIGGIMGALILGGAILPVAGVVLTVGLEGTIAVIGALLGAGAAIATKS